MVYKIEILRMMEKSVSFGCVASVCVSVRVICTYSSSFDFAVRLLVDEVIKFMEQNQPK